MSILATWGGVAGIISGAGNLRLSVILRTDKFSCRNANNKVIKGLVGMVPLNQTISTENCNSKIPFLVFFLFYPRCMSGLPCCVWWAPPWLRRHSLHHSKRSPKARLGGLAAPGGSHSPASSLSDPLIRPYLPWEVWHWRGYS